MTTRTKHTLRALSTADLLVVEWGRARTEIRDRPDKTTIERLHRCLAFLEGASFADLPKARRVVIETAIVVDLALTFIRVGFPFRAAKLLEQRCSRTRCETLEREMSSSRLAAYLYLLAGIAADQSERLRDARRWYKRCLAVLAKPHHCGRDRAARSLAHHNIAMLYVHIGDVDDARIHLEAAVDERSYDVEQHLARLQSSVNALVEISRGTTVRSDSERVLERAADSGNVVAGHVDMGETDERARPRRRNRPSFV